jgi:hypothetical protein
MDAERVGAKPKFAMLNVPGNVAMTWILECASIVDDAGIEKMRY